MPWEFRKKLSSDSSSFTSKKQEPQPQRIAQHDQIQRSPPQQTQHAFTNVVNQVLQSRQNEQYPSTSYASQTSSAGPKSRGLAPDVYQKIKEVDQEASTLTAAGAKGLSARVVERYEYAQPMPDGSVQNNLCQTVEVIKRPGQSLGLYLREGNGEDRFDGIFVSRLQDGSELRNSGVLRVGDEILSVNKVDVTQRNIDEVVVMISTPRRLLLRTTSSSDRPAPMGETAGVSREDLDSGKFIKPLDSTGPMNKPIAILKQLPRDESRESTMTDDGAPLASSQLMATAQTSLGVRARQQESTSSLSDTPGSAYAAGPSRATYRAGSCVGSVSHQSRPRERNPLAQRSLSDRWNYGRQLSTMHTDMNPRGADEQVENADTRDVWYRTGSRGGEESSAAMTSFQSTLANTAYLPPPRLQGHLPTLERAAAMMNPEFGPSGAVSAGATPLEPYQMTPSVPCFWNPQHISSVDYIDPSGIYSPRSVASDSRLTGPPVSVSQQSAPRSVLRQPSAFPTSIFPSIKSNSLPRRHPAGRTIKWRNDVLMDDPSMSMSTMNPMYFQQPTEMSDSDGAVSAPELALSPAGSYVPVSGYSMSRTPTAGKTIDDVFSCNEYQAWTRVPTQPSLPTTRFDPRYMPFPDQRSYMQMSSQQRPYQTVDTDPGYGYYMAQSTSSLPPDTAGEYWSRRADQDFYATGPVPAPTLSRSAKIRSSSLPPRGVLNQPPISTDYDQHIYENISYPDTRGGDYFLDVSPLPRRRLPLSLAATNPNFGYAADLRPTYENQMQMETVTASLTGLVFLRIIEGRQIRSRDPEEMYCVVEFDGEHRARTEVSDWQAGFHWNELFEIDVCECRRVDFYIYSWHPQYRHKLRHRGFLQLVDTLLNQKFDPDDELGLYYYGGQTNHSFALNLDPRGQLFIQIGFHPMPIAFRRQLANRRSAYWGVPLQILVERESASIAGGGHVPTVFRRLIQEIERRAVDMAGLYVLCGSSSKKHLLRDQLEREPALADLSPDLVPDLNILTSVLKDFLRELPEPLVPNCTFQMLLEAWKVCAPNDKEGNAKLMLGVIDCLSRVNKCTFMVLMDHLKYAISQSPHNGLSLSKCGVVFGPLIFCTSQAYPLTPHVVGQTRFGPPKPYFSFLDHRLAARLLELLLDLWPCPRSEQALHPDRAISTP